MKTLMRLFVLLFVTAIVGTAGAQNDAIQKYFDKYMSDERFKHGLHQPQDV